MCKGNELQAYRLRDRRSNHYTIASVENNNHCKYERTIVAVKNNASTLSYAIQTRQKILCDTGRRSVEVLHQQKGVI